MTQPYIHSIFVGQPKTLADERGEWRSSIWRDLARGPVEIEVRGLAGDQATQPYHGGLDSAVCCHFLDHYRFWNSQYDLNLQAGNVGENFVLEHITEEEVCIGDVYRVGTGLVQVSCPRVPCETQARRIGRSDWVKLTLKELRPGFYLRVLEPGVVQAGDEFRLEERPNPGSSLTLFNRCWYHEFDPHLAEKFTTMTGLMPRWQERFAEKLEQHITNSKNN
ncbi:MAG: MOSC domain-containing protein [Ardenticatenaceae bacterium]|nr:MOSC domain-containing protein [Ardenticatenaceae bacterium]